MNAHRTSVYLLVAAVIGLIVLGLVMLSSTGAFAPHNHGDPLFFLKRQMMWLGLAAIACCIGAWTDYHVFQRGWWLLLAVSFVLLLLCFVPHVGIWVKGAWRWIHVGSFSFQPSEMAKLAAVATLAWWFAKDEERTRDFWKGFVLPLAGLAVFAAPIAREVDMGTTALLGAVTIIIMFVAGVRLRFLAPFLLAGLGGLAFVITKMPNRLGRVLAFLYPDRPQYAGAAYQQLQGLIALGSGGAEGLGLGMGRQKMAFLPEAHTDFILPVIGEELGLRITLLIVFAFVVILMCGGSIALRARDRFGMLFGFGILMLITGQAAVNIGVTTMLLPNKGFPLPFISYGGTNLVFCLSGIGILINIYRQGLNEKDERRAGVMLSARTRNARRVVRL